MLAQPLEGPKSGARSQPTDDLADQHLGFHLLERHGPSAAVSFEYRERSQRLVTEARERPDALADRAGRTLHRRHGS
jgi:hypothetical protein